MLDVVLGLVLLVVQTCVEVFGVECLPETLFCYGSMGFGY